MRAGRPLEPEAWPDGARCAVALSFDCDHETFEMGAGRAAIGRLSWGEYGRRARRAAHPVHARTATTCGRRSSCPAVSGLIDPAALGPIVEAGHEIGVHGWIHENTSKLDRATERELMLRARDALEAMTGQRPVGPPRGAVGPERPAPSRSWRSWGCSTTSSLMADDACYELLADGRPTGVVEIPVDWVRDDAVYLLFNREPPARPFTPPEAVFDIFRREFDMAFDEGGVCQLTFHPFVIGYRSRIWILDQLIAHAKARGPVWFPTHAELAAWVLRA